MMVSYTAPRESTVGKMTNGIVVSLTPTNTDTDLESVSCMPIPNNNSSSVSSISDSIVKSWLSEPDNMLLVLTMLGVTIGCMLGFILRAFELSDTTVMLISFPGELLMNMLKLIILPMIIASILASLVELDTRTSSRMGLITLGYYTCTTTFAVIISLVTVMIIRPGDIARSSLSVGHDFNTATSMVTHKSPLDMGLDFLRRAIPENIFQALISEVNTKYDDVIGSNTTERVLVYADNPNILGIVTCSVAIGLAVAASPIKGKPVARLMVSLNDIIKTLVNALMWLVIIVNSLFTQYRTLPFGVIFLVSGSIIKLDADLGELVTAISAFVGTSMLAQTIHFFFVLPLAYFMILRKNPYTFLRNQFPAYANTLGHASSSAALPVTSNCLESKNNVDYRVSQFVLPVGAVVNVDGGALYEALAAVFVAQMNGMDLGWTQALAVILTVTMSSVGSSSLPGAGLVSVLPLISPIPVSNADVAMLIVTDWFLDRYRTCNSVMGDSIGAAIVEKLCDSQLRKFKPERLPM